MNATALSNSLFVNNVTAIPQRFKAEPASGPVKSRQNSFAGKAETQEPEEAAVAEQNQTAGDEPLEFKHALGEQSDKQLHTQQDEEGAAESDNSTAGSTANYVLAVANAMSFEAESLDRQADIAQVSAEQKALAVLTYLRDSKLADNPGNAGEAISEVVEKMLGWQTNGTAAVVMVGEGTQITIAEGTLEKALTQLDLSSAGGEMIRAQQTTETAEAVDRAEPEQNGQQVNQQASEIISQAAELSVGKEPEDVDSAQIKVNTIAVVNENVVNVAKTTQQNDAAAESVNQQVEQISEGLTGQIKSSTDKDASKNEAWSFLKQDNGEQAVINADTAEKGVEVSKTSQSEQHQFGKEVFDKVGEQIQASVSNSVRQGESEVTVRLNPPELGRVVIKLQQQDGQVAGLLEFSKAETRVEVQQLLPQLVRNLQDAGIAVRRLDVVQTQIENSGHQQFREHAAGDGAAYQQQFSQGQPDNYGLGYDWLSAEPVYAGTEFLSELQGTPSAYISDQTVNVLV
jgi:flagellar hook-length control protein FliK